MVYETVTISSLSPLNPSPHLPNETPVMERTPSAPPAPTSTEHDQVHKDLKSHYRSASVPILNTDDDVASNPIKAPSALPPPLFAPGLSLSPHLRTSTALSPGSPILRNAVPLQTGASQKFKSALVSWAEDVILNEQVPPEWGSNEVSWPLSFVRVIVFD